VLDHDPAFRWQKDELDAGAALAEAVIGQRKEEIRELAQRLRGLQAGSAEHTELDLEILRQTAELKSQVERARRKLAAEEGRVYVEAYREIVQAVEAHLDETDCRLVLRIDAPNIDAPNVVLGAGRLAPVEDPAERPQSIHRTVVSSQDAADITPAILRRLAADRQKSAARMRRPARR
jgi:hypothetical protein